MGERDELMTDLEASIAGAVVTEAVGGAKKLASALGVGERQGRRYAHGARGNPVHQTGALIDKATDEWTIPAYLNARAVRRTITNAGALTEWRWRALYIEACKLEQPADGHEDVTTQAMLMGEATLTDQMNADMKVASCLMRRIALAEIGTRNGWSVQGVRG